MAKSRPETPQQRARREAEEARQRDQQRIDQQRFWITQLPPGAAVDRLKEAMMQRVYDLMWDGRAEEADAILEFLPEKDAQAVLDAWSDDFEPRPAGKPFSRWH